MPAKRFENREDAGKQMAAALKGFDGKSVVVLALPRGGIVPAAEIAKKLNAPLDVVLVRKIAHPLSPEYAIGAVAHESKPILNKDEVPEESVPWLDRSIRAGRELNKKRFEEYYGDGDVRPVSLKGKKAILVDDGIATGYTMEAAVEYAKGKEADKIILAVPVAPTDSAFRLRKKVDEVLVLDDTENYLGAVGAHYTDFQQVTDEEVIKLLKESRKKKT